MLLTFKAIYYKYYASLNLVQACIVTYKVSVIIERRYQIMRVAIVGVGNISVEHINAYLNNPRVTLVAFCDTDEEQLTKQGEAFG